MKHIRSFIISGGEGAVYMALTGMLVVTVVPPGRTFRGLEIVGIRLGCYIGYLVAKK